MTAGEITAIATIIGTAFTFLGITGVDSSVVSGAVTGVISLITIGTAVHAYFAQKKAVSASAQQ